jgi:DNA-binding transcriptional LysR family regulator
MHSVNLRNVDLNLLVALHALLEERSITGAARRISVSQPAMSRMMDRLQSMFGDELLVRTAKGYEPTNRALGIYARLQVLLPELDSLFGEREFDLSTVREVFRIETTDWGATVLIPEMMHILTRRAPGIEIDIVPRTPGFEQLEANEVDLVIAPTTESVRDTLEKQAQHVRTEPLCRERQVCMVRAGHPLAKRRLTFRAYCKAKHAALTPMLGRQRISALVQDALKRIGQTTDDLETSIRTPYFAPLGPIVERTDMVATLPLQVARRMQTSRIRILPAPSPPFHDYTYNHFWHSRNDADPVHKWLRETLRSVGASVSTDHPFAGAGSGRRHLQ